ncbi:MAG TPA: PA2169 family four-helix-bundle protein [Saprospiraceae bacterium]|nr:PA2169 family four-helix-bundle protein [Saprospiraceae bacterium]
MQTQNSIDVLNNLITINNDRLEGYETASNETDEQDLKTLFAGFMETSHTCKQELLIEVTKLGGEVEEGTMLSGKFFRAWMEVKAALTGHDRKAILDSCEYGEDVAVDTYEKALLENQEDLTSEQRTMIKAQHTLIKADHDKVKAMRDALV